MDKKTVGLLGAFAGLATMGSANAASPGHPAADALHAASYADLLSPVPNATALLKADDSARTQASVTKVADVYLSYGYQTPYYYGVPSYPYAASRYRPEDYPRYYQEHHHHHHHHNYRDRR